MPLQGGQGPGTRALSSSSSSSSSSDRSGGSGSGDSGSGGLLASAAAAIVMLCEHHRGAWKRDADVAEAQGQGLGQGQGLTSGVSTTTHDNATTINQVLTTTTTTTTTNTTTNTNSSTGSNPLVDALLTRFHGLNPIQVAELLDTTLVRSSINTHNIQLIHIAYTPQPIHTTTTYNLYM